MPNKPHEEGEFMRLYRKAHAPQPTRTPHTALREIRSLRRLIRATHRHLDTGTLDYREAASLLTHQYNTLARLLQTDHHVNPATPQDLNAEVRDFLNRLLQSAKRIQQQRQQGLDPDDPDNLNPLPTPNDQPTQPKPPQ